MTINKHFHKYKEDWDPELVTRLSDTIWKQTAAANDRVSVLVYEANHPYGTDKYKILGVFKTNLVANQMALDFFKTKFEDHLDWEKKKAWSGVYELGSAMDPARKNCVSWHVSNSAELTLKTTEGFDGDNYCVYVQRQYVHACHQPQILEEFDSDEEPDEIEEMPELLPGIYTSYTDDQYVYF